MAKILRAWDDAPHKPKGSASGGDSLEDAFSYYDKLRRNFEAQAYGVFRKASEPEMDEKGQLHYPSARVDLSEEDRKAYAKAKFGVEDPDLAPSFIMFTSECWRGKHRPCKNICSCAHVIQDDGRHKKIYFMPYGYYLCQVCYALAERRKLDFGQCIITCWTCISDIVTDLKQKDPNFFVDLYGG